MFPVFYQAENGKDSKKTYIYGDFYMLQGKV